MKKYTDSSSFWLPDLHGGVIYDDVIPSTVSSIKSVKAGKFDNKLFFRDIKTESSLTKKEYHSKDYINQKLYLNREDIHRKDCLIRLLIEDNKRDFLVLNIGSADITQILLNCLTKYYNLSKSFDYFSGKAKDQHVVLIGCPTSRKGYDDVLGALTEFFSDVRFFLGIIVKGSLLDCRKGDKEEKKEKSFSGTTSMVIGGSFLLLSNPIRNKLLKILGNSNFKNPSLADKLLKLIQSDPNLIYSNLGSGSFFLDLDKVPQRIKDTLKNKDSISDPRTREDYVTKAIIEKKDLINYSDIDSITALAHEYGHYCVKRNPILNKLQGNQLLMTLGKMTGFQVLIATILGFSGKTTWATIMPILMSSPVLISEFAASYYGLKTLKGLGATEDDIKAMKRDMSAAFGTYLGMTLKRSAIGMTLGGMTNINNDNNNKMKITRKSFSSKEDDKKDNGKKTEKLLKQGAVATGLMGGISYGATKAGESAMKRLKTKAPEHLPAAIRKTRLTTKVALGSSAALAAAAAYQHHKNKKKSDKK